MYKEIDLFVDPKRWIIAKQLQALQRYRNDLSLYFDDYLSQVPEDSEACRRKLDKLKAEADFLLDLIKDED